jgi:hypothetical protein
MNEDIISHCDKTIIIIIIILRNSFTPKLHTEKMWKSGEKNPLVLNLGTIERANYGSCGDNSGKYGYDGGGGDDDDDENKIISGVIFYSLHRCLKTLEKDHSHCKSDNIRAGRHKKI